MKLFLFDLDWTLVYTGGAGVRALNYTFEKHFHIPHAMKTVTPDGKTDPAIIREMIRVHLQRDPKAGEIDSLCRGYIDRLRVEVAAGEGYRVMPGIPEFLKALSKRQDVLVGLGTGNLEEGAHIKLERAQLMPHFKFGGFSSDSEDRAKVLTAAVKRGEALAGHSVAPRQAYVIGDNVRDVQAGKTIGATTVAVATGPMPYEELAKTEPDFLFHDFSQTQDVIGKLLP